MCLPVCLPVCMSHRHVHSSVYLPLSHMSDPSSRKQEDYLSQHMPQLTHPGTCEAREGDSGRVQQLLHGEPGG